jgi:peptidoglycan hydrolase CwlO-like protein/3D (Asp-Asp-Asp) domain-containing protein
LNKKLSVIMLLVLTLMTNSIAFAAPSTNTSDELKQAQENKKALQGKVSELDTQIDDVIKKIDSNKKDMNKAAEDIKNTQSKLDTAEKNSKNQDDLFKKRIRAMYINDQNSYLDVILSSSNLSDFISKMDMITKVISFDNQVITKLKQEKQAITNQKEALNSKNAKLQDLKTSNETALSNLGKDVKAQKELLSKATEKEKQLLAAEASKNSQIASVTSVHNSGTLSRGMSKSVSYSQVLSMQATAYSGDAVTASGSATVRDGSSYSTIAVDPRVIPLGSRVYVEGYGYAIADDTGGAIKGNIIDLFFPSEAECENWGRRSVTVYVLN